MKKILCIIVIVMMNASCINLKPISKTEGTYCHYYEEPMYDICSKEGLPSTILIINSDSTYEIFNTSQVYDNGLYTLGIDSARGKIIHQKNKLKLEPFYSKSYDIEILKERDDDSTFIYCYFSSYEKIDTTTTFRILNKKNEVIIDLFQPDLGVIKLLPDKEDWYLQVFSPAGAGLTDYTQKKVLRIKKGKDYRLWLQSLGVTGTEEHRYELIKLDDGSYSLIRKASSRKSKYGNIEIPIFKCDFDTAMNQIKYWQYKHF